MPALRVALDVATQSFAAHAVGTLDLDDPRAVADALIGLAETLDEGADPRTAALLTGLAVSLSTVFSDVAEGKVDLTIPQAAPPPSPALLTWANQTLRETADAINEVVGRRVSALPGPATSSAEARQAIRLYVGANSLTTDMTSNVILLHVGEAIGNVLDHGGDVLPPGVLPSRPDAE